MTDGYALTSEPGERAFYQERAKTVDLDWLDVRPGSLVLDVGCGAGHLTARIAGLAQHGTVVGVDNSYDLLHDRGQRVRELGGGNPRFVLADADSLPFASETFDVACAHTVLMHLAKPDRVLRAMASVTRAGGLVAALGEGDWGTVTFTPPSAALDTALNAVLASIRGHGGDPYLGQRLESLFWQADLVDVQVEVNTNEEISVSGRDLLRAGYLGAAEPILRKTAAGGLESPARVASLLRAIEDWCHTPNSVLVWPRSVRARGRRPR